MTIKYPQKWLTNRRLGVSPIGKSSRVVLCVRALPVLERGGRADHPKPAQVAGHPKLGQVPAFVFLLWLGGFSLFLCVNDI